MGSAIEYLFEESAKSIGVTEPNFTEARLMLRLFVVCVNRVGLETKTQHNMEKKSKGTHHDPKIKKTAGHTRHEPSFRLQSPTLDTVILTHVCCTSRWSTEVPLYPQHKRVLPKAALACEKVGSVVT